MASNAPANFEATDGRGYTLAFNADEETKARVDAQNRAQEAVELDWWMTKPERAMVYVHFDLNPEVKKSHGYTHPVYMSRGEARTWIGGFMGAMGRSGVYFTYGFGGVRQRRYSVTVAGTNGIIYYGTWVESAGDYVHLKAYKNQDKAREEYGRLVAMTQNRMEALAKGVVDI
jgi:hypothetical protein